MVRKFVSFISLFSSFLSWLFSLLFLSSKPLIGFDFNGQTKFSDQLAKIRSFWQKNSQTILEEYFSFLSIPNVSTDTDNIVKNARWLIKALEKRGLETRLLNIAGAPPLILGELRTRGSKFTLGFYAHYDGQPVNASRWASDPWKPVLLDKPREAGGMPLEISAYDFSLYPEARLYARSASDDKAPIMAMLAALDALYACRISPSVNLKFIFEGEEERGSPHLSALLKANQEFLEADLWILCDGPVHQSRRPIIYFGARGIVGLELTVYGPARPLHSGHYGNWAPNPASLLANILASLRDAEGNILIEGFYRDVRPLTGEEKKALEEAPAIDDDLKKELKIAWSEGPGSIYEKILLPAMNIRGLSSGNVGPSAQNAIPTEARASLDFRLVPDQRPEKVKSLIEAHLKKRGFYVVYSEPDEETRLKFPRIVRLEWEEGYPPARMPMNDPLARAIKKTLEEVWGNQLIKLPIVGGSIPLYLFSELLHTQALILPMVNHDNNQHGENENLRLRNLWDGIEIFSCLFSRFNVSVEKTR